MTPYSRRILLSEHQPKRDAAGRSMPKLLIGAAVNATDRSVGFGSGAAPYVFAPDVSGSPDTGWTPTRQLERSQKDDGSDLTLPAMVAISGAALSPVMGRLTVSSFRFLLALLNVRLGVWVARPRRERTPSSGGPRAFLRRIDQFASRFRFYEALRRGWLQPGAYYVLKEGLGLTSLNSRYIYVTDGGHWENTGLYELARRRCTHIVVFDASNNPQNPLADFARCCQLMFTRLGITVNLAGRRRTGAELGDGDFDEPVVLGTIEYPDAPPGVLVYCRSALWSDAPPELHVYARLDSRFPRHSTTNQFLTADQFEAYRRLGWEVGCRAAELLGEKLTSPELDEVTMPSDLTAPEGTGRARPRFTVVD